MTDVMIYEYWNSGDFKSKFKVEEIGKLIRQLESDGYLIHRIQKIGYMSASVRFDNDYDAVQFKLTYL